MYVVTPRCAAAAAVFAAVVLRRKNIRIIYLALRVAGGSARYARSEGRMHWNDRQMQ